MAFVRLPRNSMRVSLVLVFLEEVGLRSDEWRVYG